MPTNEQQFDAAMMDIYRRAYSEAHYNATRYHEMLTLHGGLQTAQILIAANAVSEGYTALWERGRLDLTVEALIFDHPKYHSLFTPEELDRVRTRLQAFEYGPALA
jgi:hypothetical protein